TFSEFQRSKCFLIPREVTISPRRTIAIIAPFFTLEPHKGIQESSVGHGCVQRYRFDFFRNCLNQSGPSAVRNEMNTVPSLRCDDCSEISSVVLSITKCFLCGIRLTNETLDIPCPGAINPLVSRH